MAENDIHEASANEVDITITEDMKRGVFANQALVNHGQEEFLIDFIYLGTGGGTVNARVILTPSHYKRLIEAMQENLASYENRYGEVPRVVKERSEQ